MSRTPVNGPTWWSMLAPAPWFLFAGATYADTHGLPEAPQDLHRHPSLFMMRAGVAPLWRLRQPRPRAQEVEIRLTPRFLSNDMIALKRAAASGLGIVALPAYVCIEEVRSGSLRRVLPGWQAEDSTLTALMPSRQGVLPSVRAFVAHLVAELPGVVAFSPEPRRP